MRTFCLALTLLLFLSTNALAARYYAPPQYANGALTIVENKDTLSASLKNITGAFSYSKKKNAIKGLKLAISSKSLQSKDTETQNKIKKEINALQYPEIVFKQKGIATFKEGTARLTGFIRYKGSKEKCDAIAIIEEQERESLSFTLTFNLLIKENKEINFTVRLKSLPT